MVFAAVDNRLQALGILLFVQVPVAQRGLVVITATEPAVIDDKALNTNLRRRTHHLHDVLRVVVKVDAFPGVQVHRAHFFRLREADNFTAHMAMEVLADAVQALVAVGAVESRRAVAVARSQFHLARHQQLTGLQITTTVAHGFSVEAVVATPAQVEAVDFARGFAEVGLANHHAREVFVGGASPAVFQDKATAVKLFALGLELVGPTTVEVHDLARVGGQQQGIGQLTQLIATVTLVGQGQAGCQHIRIRVEGQVDHQLQRGTRVVAEELYPMTILCGFQQVELR